MLILIVALFAAADDPPRPNIIIVVADDMGWRDTGYRGNTVVQTPHLDEMATQAIRFDYFYAGQQMCSPGRFAILSGRNPHRTGLRHIGSTRPEEIFLPRALQSVGYLSAHFGKWHLGTGRSSPIGMGFDQALWIQNWFDLGATLQVDDGKGKVQLKEDDSSVAIMDHALEYIRKQAKGPQPFLVQVCFGSPHRPHLASDEFKALYKDLPEPAQNFWGEISGLDKAVGNLRKELRTLGIANNTILWFTSDNGGISNDSMDPAGKGKGHVGVRTQGLLEWPSRIKPKATNLVGGHIDIYPTLLDVVGVTVPDQPPLDGVSLVPLFDDKLSERPKPIGFLNWHGKGSSDRADIVNNTQGVWIDGHYKLIINPEAGKAKSPIELYDIQADPAEKNTLADKEPERVKRMRQALDAWRMSVRASVLGQDFRN
jgi:arylsulfatase A-like enzyme